MAQLLCAVAWTAAAHAAVWGGGAPAHQQQAPKPRAVAQAQASSSGSHQRPAAQPVQRQAPAQSAPATTTAATSGGSSSQIIESAFSPYGADAVAWGQRVAQCESGGSATAQNASGATGLFQFMPSTFASTPQGQAGASITDPTASAQAAAWMYSQGRQGEWSCN